MFAIVCLATLTAYCENIFAESTPASFEAANRLYFEGKYSEAAATYAMLEKSGQSSAALYFNLGNALFKSGQIGRSIAAYRQAQALAPHDPDVRANLQFARNQVQGPTTTAAKSRAWLTRLTVNEWSVLSAVSVWAFFILLGLGLWRPRWQRALRSYAVSLAVLSLFLCGCAGASFVSVRSRQTAIVVSPDVALKQGPLEGSQNVLTVHDGSELHVLDDNNDWLQVEAPGPRAGWVSKADVVVVR
jgi:tetratricopeptide (TPR) repeat protein